jgi:hypothetical protein
MPVIDEILSWSKGIAHPWVRDALRRVVTTGDVTPADVSELAEMCKKAHGLSDTQLIPEPLDGTHLGTAPDGGPVSVVSVTHVSDVNALAPNETIAFTKSGLTVVYGDNGAGKSGYSRILKKACRARGSNEPILPNALSEKPAGTPTAKITVAVGDAEAEHLWKSGTTCDAALSAVSVFDSGAAQVYVADRTEVRFRPFGLDVLDKLANVTVQVKSRLEREKQALEAAKVVWPDLAPNTEAQRLLANLSALTSRDLVQRLATVSEEEQLEFETLKSVLATARAEDPTKKAAELKTKATRIRRLVSELEKLATSFGAESLQNLQNLAREASEARQLAQDAAQTFQSGSLQGLASPAWRTMWEAARAYSEGSAYPQHAFPHVDDAQCVLCQQTLNAQAKGRLRQFEDYVRGQAEATLRTKEQALKDARNRCLSISPGEATRDAIDDLDGLNATVGEHVRGFVGRARETRAALEQGLIPEALTEASQAKEVSALADALEERSKELSRAADPAERKKTQDRHDELDARKTLAGLRARILDEVDRKARVNAYEACMKDTDTRAMTKLSSELTKKYVTEALTKSFAAELAKLGFSALELELRPVSASKGVLYHQVQLTHATRAELPKVVSEGEGRCIALAAFLAEVGSAAHASAIVFDDPVSSLDHIWRTNVARRLVKEAEVRQVIVFTHELVFLSALLHEAESRGVGHSALTVSRGGDALAGHVDTTLPWNGMSVQRRIGAINDEWQRAEKVFRTMGQTAYEPLATGMYAKLRKTWERAVEEVLFNQVVLRFRDGVETKRLKADITQEDVDAIEAGMTKCSKWEGGHDQALAVNEHLPPPDEVKADISVLEGWVAAVETRRRKRRS